MDFYERIASEHDALQLIMDGRQVQIWTAQPGMITKVSDLGGKITVDVQPAIQGKVASADGTVGLQNLPIIPDVPLVVQHGGGYMATYPVAVGDEVLIVHAARNIDGWWQSGGIQPPLDSRLHDLSDAFAIHGPFSQATKPANYSTTTAQFRSIDGTVVVELDQPNGKVNIKAAQEIDLEAPGELININAGTIDIAGTVNITGTVHITGALVINGTTVAVP